MRSVFFTLIVWLGIAATALGQSVAPQIWLQPVNQTGEAGANVTFLVAASGSPAPTLQWQFSTDGNTWSNLSGAGFSGGTTNLLTIVGATTSQTGNQFRCVATNSVNSATSNAVTLTVLPAGFVNVTSIAVGGYFSLFIKSDGSLWATGYNDHGQLGDGTTKNKKLPEQMISSGVVAIAVRGAHDLILKSDGSVWAVGDNSNGQLGDGTTTDKHLPEEVISSGVVAMAAGGRHSLFIKNDGSLWAVGDNEDEELGDGTTTQQATPEQVVASGVVAIAGGDYHSLFLKSDGSLWAMGENASGQLGDGTTTNQSTPEQIVASGVIAIAAYGDHDMFLKSDGSLWAMGDNTYGELGDGTTTNRSTPEQIVASGVVTITAGFNNSLFVKNDGSFWGMGDNADGQLGDGTTTRRSSPEEILASSVVAITVGEDHTLFLDGNSNLWAMGDNSDGELGDDTTANKLVPEQILPGFDFPAITIQPINSAVIAGANSIFILAGGGSPAPTYQWQVSTDGGNTWANLSDNSTYSGTASTALTVNDTTTAELGYQFQAIITNSVGTTTSTPVPLVVGSSAAKLAWLQNNFTLGQLGNPGIIGDLATPANDGIPNLIKYAFNLPAFVNGQASLPQVTEGSGDLTLTFQPMQSDLTYTVEASTDLATWSTTGVNTAINAGVETATYAIPGQGAAFLRVVVAPSP